MSKTQDLLAARYYELCDQRDAVNAEIEPLQAELDAANLKVSEAQEAASKIAAKIQSLRGGQTWIDLKKEIGSLANAMKKIPPRQG